MRAAGVRWLLVCDAEGMLMGLVSLGLRVVAEGVENAAQLLRLREQGCDEVQSFLFGAAMSPDASRACLLRRPESF
ncbi:hypothetical protein [Paucibacter soli]|uniref:hypothetical protein n=1 Tax=Paucibacter soli TaxID=3133433 RepID=UPI0030991E08